MSAVLTTLVHTWWISGPIGLAVFVDALQRRHNYRTIEVPIPFALTDKAQQLLHGGDR